MPPALRKRSSRRASLCLWPLEARRVAGRFATALPLVLSTGAVACGSAEPGRDQLGFGRERTETGGEARAPDDGAESFFETEPLPAGGNGCPVQRLPLREERRPLDIILVLDNSVSMALELEAVERSINVGLAGVLEASGADYRLILISRHRTDPRSRTDQAKTAICVSQPLSAVEECPAPRPGLTERFFHYGVDIDSSDSLDRLVGTYDQPDPLYRATAVGWSEWLREGSRKVFLEFTDDDSLTPAREFVRTLVSLAPEHFGPSVSRLTFAFHSIVGIAPKDPPGSPYRPEEPLVVERCTDGGRPAPSSGRTYQTLSRLTGGLRYPLCALDQYERLFESIARDGLRRSGVACSFDVPAAPPGKRIDTERLALVWGGADQPAAQLARVSDRDACAPDAFYVDSDRIELCPELCENLAALPTATVSAEFDCKLVRGRALSALGRLSSMPRRSIADLPDPEVRPATPAFDRWASQRTAEARRAPTRASRALCIMRPSCGTPSGTLAAHYPSSPRKSCRP